MLEEIKIIGDIFNKIDSKITTPAIATLISATVAYIISKRTNKRADKASLDNRYNEIMKINLTTPYFEDASFSQNWKLHKNNGNERNNFYHYYCKLLFKFLEAYCIYYNFNKKKIENNIDIKEWVNNHKQWWTEPYFNNPIPKRYSKKFIKYIDSIME